MGKKCTAFIFIIFFLFVSSSLCQDEDDKTLEFGAMAAIENGQFIKSNYNQQPMPYRPWLNREYVQLWARAVIGEHVEFRAQPEFKLWNDTYNWQIMGNNAFANPFITHTLVSIIDAEGIYSMGDSESVRFKIAAGVIPYKYNSEARNLGEYLFRTGARPAYILTAFDDAYARLTGLRLNASLFNKVDLDLFFTTETHVQPLSDWSLSFLCTYKLPPYLTVGAGVMLDRLFYVNKSLEEPVNPINEYLTKDGEIRHMRFGGVKVMGHATFDPKALIPSRVRDMLGSEDGKVYAEAAVLGVQSYTAYKREDPFDSTSAIVVDSAKNFYSDVYERIPVMFGFSIPTFKVLDYLSVELEWYGWPYPNSFGQVEGFKYINPQPYVMQSVNPAVYKKDDNWKYSFNARKSFPNGFSVLGQISRDHTHHDVYYYVYVDESEVFSQKDNWGWWLKLQYSF